MVSYQPGIPTGTINLDVDYINIRDNFTKADTSFGTDHVPFSSGTLQNGYHTSIHFNPISTTITNPPNNMPPNGYTTVPGIGQLFGSEINDGNSIDTALFSLTGNGILTQLTSNFLPVIAPNGYTYLPGGLILQWGRVNSITNGTVTFATANKSFPNSCFGVWTTAFWVGATVPSGVATVNIKLNTNISFDWVFNTNSGQYAGGGFFWIAVGN